MDSLENKLIVLSKMFPNDMVFGAEVRKVVKKIKSERNDGDLLELKTQEDLFEAMKNNSDKIK